MNPKNKQVATIASILSGLIIALFYHFELIPVSKTMMTAAMILLSLAWVYFSYYTWKTQWVITYLLIWIIGCTIEWIGIVTCRPYGCFQYTDLLWPKFFNTFPYLLMWVRPFIVISTAHLVPKKLTWRPFIILWILLLLLLDLALDPVHIHQWVRSYNQSWTNRFGVPLQNFLGRILTGGFSMLIFQWRKNTIIHESRYYSGIALMTLFWTQFLLIIIF